MDKTRTHRRCAPRFAAHQVHRLLFVMVLLAQCGSGYRFAHAQSPETDRYQAYELKYKDAAEAESLLNEMLEGFQGSVDVVADTKANRLLVNGPEKAQRIAAKLLKKIDQPTVEDRPPAESVVKSYPCPQSKLTATATRLRNQYLNTNGVRIAGDATGERLLILAPAEIHEEIQTALGDVEPEAEPAARKPLPPRQNARPTAARPTNTDRDSFEPLPISRNRRAPQPAQPDRRGTTNSPTSKAAAAIDAVENSDNQFVELQHVHPDTVPPLLRKLLGPRLEPVGESKREYRVTDQRGAAAELIVDRKRNGIRISGDRDLCTQLAAILRGVDDPTGNGNDQTRVLPLRGIDPDQLRLIQDAFRQDVRQTPAAQRSLRTSQNPKKSSAVQHAHFEDGQNQLSVIRLVGNQQPAANNYAGNPDIADPADVDSDDLRKQLRRLGSDLEVEIIPDLDVIIIRGNKTEVQDMTRILKELERLSLETEPKVEIYPLKHVRGESLAALIERVNADLTGGLRGKVTITPLIKPNALLLIGWGDTVTSVKELIAALDQPIPPDAQFQVFRLKHADAVAARTTIQDFFTSRTPAATGTTTASGPGLAPRVQITADLRTNSLIVQAPPRDLQEAAQLIEQLDVPSGAVVHQARVFKLKNTLATDLATILQTAINAAGGQGSNAASQKSSMLEFMAIDKEGQQILRSGVLADVKITAEPHTNSLLVSASPDSMELIAALIRRLDESVPEGAQIKVFRVINGDAVSLVTMLRSLLPPPNGPPGSPQLSGSRDETSLVPTRFSVDLRTNSIIATGSTGDLRIIEALLLRLDQRDVEQRRNMVYRLKNASAEAVARSVNDFLRSERTVAQAAPGAISPFQQIESEVVVVPELVSNSLIISATPRFFDDIEKLVEKLDAQPPQVMIQVLIAQVALNNTNEFGVELGLQDSLLFDRSLLGSLVTTTESNSLSTPAGIVSSTLTNVLGASNTPGFAWNGAPLPNSGAPSSVATSGNVAGQAVSNFGVGSTNSQLGYGGLVLSASSESVSVLVRALQQSNRLEVLSRPQIRTLDNQPAYIQIGQRVPRLVNISVNVGGSVNGVTLENVGLILGVTPRISPDGMVVMEVDAEKSEVDTTNLGIPVSASSNGTIIRSPLFNITQASTTVSANSGETIIIGGLITKNTADTVRRVPYLSDIPVVGNLFRYDSSITQRSELLIILTPYVIRGPEESARIKREEVARMHWCAGDVAEVYGPGVIEESPMFLDSPVPVIYPDLNPRGTIVPTEIPSEPTPITPPAPGIPDSARGQIKGKAEAADSSKPKQSTIFSSFGQKKRK